MIIKNFINFWTNLFVRPKVFFSKCIAETKQNRLFFLLAFILFAGGYKMSGWIHEFHHIEIVKDFEQQLGLYAYWMIKIIVSMLGIYFLYLIGSFIFDVRLRLSGGTSNRKKTNRIFLYSEVISSVVIIIIPIVYLLTDDKTNVTGFEIIRSNLFIKLLVLFSMYYSVYVSYSGVKAITDANKSKSKIWFLILPLFYYTIKFDTLFGGQQFLKCCIQVTNATS